MFYRGLRPITTPDHPYVPGSKQHEIAEEAGKLIEDVSSLLYGMIEKDVTDQTRAFSLALEAQGLSDRARTLIDKVTQGKV